MGEPLQSLEGAYDPLEVIIGLLRCLLKQHIWTEYIEDHWVCDNCGKVTIDRTEIGYPTQKQ